MPLAGVLGDHVAGIVDDVGVVAGAADQRVGAGAAVERVVAGAAGQDVGRSIAVSVSANAPPVRFSIVA